MTMTRSRGTGCGTGCCPFWSVSSRRGLPASSRAKPRLPGPTKTSFRRVQSKSPVLSSYLVGTRPARTAPSSLMRMRSSRCIRALASRVARIALTTLAGGRQIGYGHIERLLALADGQASAVSLPGQRAVRLGERIRLERPRPAGLRELFSYSAVYTRRGPAGAAGVGSVGAPRRRCGRGRSGAGRGHARDTRGEPGGPSAGGQVAEARETAFVRPGCAVGGRSCRISSWIGKSPGTERDGVPLVVDGDDRIVWVVGHAVAEDFRVTDAFTRRVTLESKAVRRPRLNSTLKSLLFWMVLVVVGVLIWQFSDGLRPTPAHHPVLSVPAEGRGRGRRQRGDHRATRSPAAITATRGERRRQQVPHVRADAVRRPRQQARRARASASTPSPNRPARGRRCSTRGRRSC